MEGKIDMAARRQVTNKLRDAYRKNDQIQTQLSGIARATTEELAAAKPLDLEALQPSINRSTPTKAKP